MSPRGSSQSRRVAVAKAKNDIFTALLGIAVGALVIAVALLALVMNRYDWSVSGSAMADPVVGEYSIAANALLPDPEPLA